MWNSDDLHPVMALISQIRFHLKRGLGDTTQATVVAQNATRDCKVKRGNPHQTPQLNQLTTH